MVWYGGMVWYGMVRYGMVWYGMVNVYSNVTYMEPLYAHNNYYNSRRYTGKYCFVLAALNRKFAQSHGHGEYVLEQNGSIRGLVITRWRYGPHM